MPYPECKVYSGGSHYIAIPHTEKRYRPRPKKQEEKRLHQKKPNGVIPFGLIFLSVLSNFFPLTSAIPVLHLPQRTGKKSRNFLLHEKCP